MSGAAINESKVVTLNGQEYEVARVGLDIWAFPHGWDGIGYLFRPGDRGRELVESALETHH